MKLKNKFGKKLLEILKDEKIISHIEDDCDIPIYDSSNKKNKNKKVLILSGGGIKGIAHIGAMKALDELNYLNNFEEFASASVGSLIIGMYLVGYSPNEMWEFVKRFDFGKLIKIDIFGLFENFGVDDGENITYVIKRLISSKAVNENITLKDIYLKTKKKFMFTTVCINSKKTVYMSHENYPNMPLYKAILMSISIPWFYSPVKYNGNLFIDGGCMDNYPIHKYKNRLDDVIGIYLTEGDDYIEKFDNIEVYSQRVLECLGEGVNFNSKKGFEKYTINLHVEPISFINFNINVETKEKIYNKGYKTIMHVLK